MPIHDVTCEQVPRRKFLISGISESENVTIEIEEEGKGLRIKSRSFFLKCMKFREDGIFVVFCFSFFVAFMFQADSVCFLGTDSVIP